MKVWQRIEDDVTVGLETPCLLVASILIEANWIGKKGKRMKAWRRKANVNSPVCLGSF